MDLTFMLGFMLLGLVVGAAVARFITLKQFNKHQLQQDLDSSRHQLDQYRQDVSHHLDTTHQLMSQLQENYSRIAQHMAQSKMQLVDLKSTPDNEDLNYLTTDTAADIRQSLHQLNEKRRVHSSLEQQPKDYSGESSGLMSERSRHTAE